MNAIWTHLRIRLHATLTDPWAAIMLVGASLPCIALWPGPGQTWWGEGWLGHEFLALFMLAGMLVWSHFVASIPGGFDAGGKTGGANGIHPMPTLPVGARGRVFAEALIPLVIVLALRIPGVFVVDAACAALDLPRWTIDAPWFWIEYAGDSLAGAALMLAVLVAYASPVSNQSSKGLKSLAYLLCIFVAFKLGLLSTVIGCMLVGGVLSAIALMAVRWEPSASVAKVCESILLCAMIYVWLNVGAADDAVGLVLLVALAIWIVLRIIFPKCLEIFAKERRLARCKSCWRVARNPESQLRRDQWLLPLIDYWPVIAGAVGLQIAAVLSDHSGALSQVPWWMLSLMLLLHLTFQPYGKLGSPILSGALGADENRCGDFAAAWSALPVRREAVLRGVYLHVLLVGTATWMLILAGNYWSSWLATGQFCLVNSSHEPIGWVLLPLIAIVPCAAGLMTAAAVGDRKGLMLSAGAAVALSLPLVLLSLRQTADPISLTWLIAATAIGGLPPLHLRRPVACAERVEEQGPTIRSGSS